MTAMIGNRRDSFRVQPEYQPLMRMLGIDAAAVFDHPQIVAWRTLGDRENCTLDTVYEDKPLRLHIKRYRPSRGSKSPADAEIKGIMALQSHSIPTIPLVGWGMLSDGRSFVISADLAGYADAEKLAQAGLPLESLINPTADLAAKLHKADLHHRDLYLCHFFAKKDDPTDLRLIDVARVKRMAFALTRNRWIVKDLAQFCYSIASLATDDQRERWLKRYAESRGIPLTPAMRRAIEKKVAWIAKHDQKLRKSQPARNISIPTPPAA